MFNPDNNDSNNENMLKIKRINKKKLHKEHLKNIWNNFKTNEQNIKKSIEIRDIKNLSEEKFQNLSPKDRDICDKCNSLIVVSEEGYSVCNNGNCAIIYDDVLNFSPEWKFYGADDQQNSDPSRCGIPNDPLFEESANSCKILSTANMSYTMRKIRRYVQWQTMQYKEKSQYDDFQYISLISLNNGIAKKIVDDAFIYYKKIFECQISFRGENRDSIIAASIYISFRINNYPRTAKEIAQIFKLDFSAATKGCKKALAIINTIEKNYTNDEKTTYCLSKPSLFAERFCNRLNMAEDYILLCEFICIKLEHYGFLAENTPQAIAVGVIYFISDIFKLGITKKNIHSAIEISEVTINKCYKKIIIHKDKLIPRVFINKLNVYSRSEAV